MGKRIFLFILGAWVLLMGSFFTWLMARSYSNAKATRQWTEVPAMILEARIEEQKLGVHVPTEFGAVVLYGYEFQEERYTSDLISRRGTKWAKEREKAEKELGELKAGPKTVCWVNPAEPKVAILQHDTKAAGYSIWFPLLFVVGGFGVMLGAFRKS